MSGKAASTLHAYGVIDPSAGPVEFAGIGGARVEIEAIDALGVLVSWLPPERYGEAAWRAHAQDPSWLRDVAREHHAVLQAWSDCTDVVPFRLPSLHAGMAGLRRAMQTRLGGLSSALAAIRGQWEWGLKIFLEVDPAPAKPGRATSGRDYLVQRTRAASGREQARDRRAAAIREVHEAFASSTTRAVISTPQDPALSGRPAPMLLNAAYLAPRSERERLLALAGEQASRVQPLGLRVELTGPWPPYHFASIEPALEGEGHERPRHP